MGPPKSRFHDGIGVIKMYLEREFSGGPMVRTLSFHCRGLVSKPWSGN